MALLDDTSPYSSLLRHYFSKSQDYSTNWSSEDYDHNLSHPENLIHKTICGYMVRSKSEAIIANCLFLNKIPHRYECALHLDDLLFYPDFTILHPKTHKLFYWEHFGMMDRPSYCEHTFHKLKIYSQYHIIPSIHLITTYETQAHPIDSGQVQRLVNEYFG